MINTCPPTAFRAVIRLTGDVVTLLRLSLSSRAALGATSRHRGGRPPRVHAQSEASFRAYRGGADASTTEPQNPIIISSHVWSPHFTSFVGSGLYLLPGELS